MTGDPTGIKLQYDPTRQRMSGIAIHGNTPFDVPFISKIADNLWQGGCRNGLILPKFFNHLISLYPWEQYKVKHELFSLMSVMMLDSSEQPFEQVDVIAAWANLCRKTGPVLVHCQAGLNRSSLITARALMLDGSSADEAIALLREKRTPACLCNSTFEEWLRRLDG